MDKALDLHTGSKKVLVASSGGLSNSKQFVVTQSKGTTIIQPADVANRQGQQYVVTVSSGGASSGTHTPAYQAVQYIDANGRAGQTADTVVYANNPQVSHVQYQIAGDQYVNSPVQYSYAPASAVQFHSSGGEVVHHMGQTFFIQGGTMDGEGYPLAHTTRAAPVTVKWLIENFEACDGVSLPRSVIYNFYIHHCQTENIEASNPASFGKLVRMIFRDLKTRRLGQRGNSRYHYYGIRIKPSSTLNQLMPDETPVAMRQPTQPQRKSTTVKTEADESMSDTMSSHAETPAIPSVAADDKNKQYLGAPVAAIPQTHLQAEPVNMPQGITQHDLKVFEQLYKKHCEDILDVVISLQFSQIESIWQKFWRKSTAGISPALEAKLSKDKLYVISRMSEVQSFIKSADYSFYQSLIEVLIPDVLRPIPSSLTQAIRNFAKNLIGWLRSALSSAPDEVLAAKLSALTAFAQTLRRYTSLNHLAQAARAVLINTAQIQQMMTDIARVDFSNIQEQAAWVCQCDDETVQRVQQDFKEFLQDQHDLDDWKDWLENVVDMVLKAYENQPEKYSKAARNFLLKWSFYSSMVIRDLTLRSAASFGSFHLIRLLYDEYLFYLVEHKIAAATSRTPIAVMSELIENNDQLKAAGNKRKQTISTIVSAAGDSSSSAAKRMKPAAASAIIPGSF